MIIACIVENKKRFSQTFSTPLIQSNLIEQIGYNVEKEEGKQILEESFVIPTGISQYMARVIN